VNTAVIVPLPVADGAVYERTTAFGVTLTAADAGPMPTALVAVTEQLYAVPLVSPVTVSGEAAPEAVNAPHVAVYVVMGEPPFETGGNYHGVSAAIEFGVLNLRVKHLIVLGHSGCGGVKASLDQSAAIQTEAQFISRWMSLLDEARLAVLAEHKGESSAAQHTALEMECVKTSIKNLRTFPFVKNDEDRGHLALHGAHFNIKTGTLSVYNATRGAFLPL